MQVLQGLRKYQLLRWVSAVNGDFPDDNQIVSAGNLAAHFMEEGAMKDVILDNFNRYNIRKRERKVWDFLRRGLNMRINRNNRYFSRSEHKTRETEENSLHIEWGIKRPMKVYTFSLFQDGKNEISRLESHHSNLETKAKDAHGDVPHDTVLVPEERRFMWEVVEVSVPRIKNEVVIDTGEKIPDNP